MLMNIPNKGSRTRVPSKYYSTLASYDKRLSIYSLSFFIFQQYIICDVYGLRSPSFQSNDILYIITFVIIGNSSSLQELVWDVLNMLIVSKDHLS